MDQDGLWNRLVGETLPAKQPGVAFLQPSVDSAEARAFLQLAGVEELPADTFVDLMELAGKKGRPAEWWIACYQLLAEHREFRIAAFAAVAILSSVTVLQRIALVARELNTTKEGTR